MLNSLPNPYTDRRSELPRRVLEPRRKWYAEEDLPQGLVFVTRDEWGAVEPECNPVFDQLTPLKEIAYRINFNCTGSIPCYNQKECKTLLQGLQENYMDFGYPDIIHNFMIGSDGRVYEGRGWDMRPDHLWGRDLDRCLDIAFIGWFTEENCLPFPIQIATAYKLLDYGIKSKKIQPKYRETWFRDEKWPGEGERRRTGIMGRQMRPKVTRLKDIYDEFNVSFA